MSYWGYIPFLKNVLSVCSEPKILEVGIDYGATTIPLLFHLVSISKEFKYHCVDILLRPTLKVMLDNMTFHNDQELSFFIMNSIEFLAQSNEKYDIILIDGDHNYHTVSSELAMINDHITDTGIIIVDDYEGRWADNDLWYIERESHTADNVQKIATKRVETEKHGVKAAVHDFLESNSQWKGMWLVGEPIVLMREAQMNNFLKSLDHKSLNNSE